MKMVKIHQWHFGAFLFALLQQDIIAAPIKSVLGDNASLNSSILGYPSATDLQYSKADDSMLLRKNSTNSLSNNPKGQHAGQIHQLTVNDITFKRSINQGAILSLHWQQNNPKLSVEENQYRLVIRLKDAVIDKHWLHKIDTSSFNTIVDEINIALEGKDIIISLTMKLPFVYQYEENEDALIVSIDKKQTEVPGFNANKKISLKFQSISIRALLQMMAKFVKLNLVINDAVDGDIAINLDNVPWEEALHIVLMSKGLGKRQLGDILYIAPMVEITEQDEKEALAKKTSQQVAALEVAYIHLNYASAAGIAKILTSNLAGAISARGSVAADERTNTLIVSDTEDQLQYIKSIVNELDYPLDQVLIEARIVEVSKESAFELGLGYKATKSDSTVILNARNIDITKPKDNSSIASLAFKGLFGGIDLNLELAALETEGNAKVVSSPHLMVTENTEAYVKQGSEIPYEETTASGAASITFKEAVLELKVTPQIAPNGNIILSVTIKKDAQSTGTAGKTSQPILDKREIATKLMIKNGNTVVLGGIYEKNTQRSKSKVPLLGDIPLLGWLFSSVSNKITDKELLIFLTPKIVSPNNQNEPSANK